MSKVLKWFKSNIIFTIVVIIALSSCIFVPIDSVYATYFEGSGATLTCIFGILIIVAGLENIEFFQKVARFLIKKFKNARSIILTLIFITYVSSLINANDMAFNSTPNKTKRTSIEKLSLYNSINEWKDFCHKQILAGNLDVIA